MAVFGVEFDITSKFYYVNLQKRPLQVYLDYPAIVRLWRGLCHYKLGQWKKARHAFQRVLQASIRSQFNWLIIHLLFIHLIYVFVLAVRSKKYWGPCCINNYRFANKWRYGCISPFVILLFGQSIICVIFCYEIMYSKICSNLIIFFLFL